MFGWFKRVGTKRPRPRDREGKFIATRDVPIEKRDVVAYAFDILKQEKKHHCKARIETRQALINAFNKERIKNAK